MSYVESYAEARIDVTWKTKWKCVWCSETIPAGEKHVRYNGWWENIKQNWGMHSECYEAFSKEFHNEGGTFVKHAYQRGSTEEKDERAI